MRNRLPFVLLTFVACGDNIRPFTDAATARDSPLNGDAIAIDAPAACSPNAVLCDGDSVVTCSAAGDEETRTICVMGCDGTKVPPRCLTPVPSNLATDTCTTAAAGDLTVAANQTITLDTSAANCDVVQSQGAGLPVICVRKFANVTIDGTVIGAGANVLAIVATTSMTINGTIDVSSRAAASGPAGTSTDSDGGQPAQASAGGGGAGYLTAGGAGAVSSLITGGNGGAAGPAVGTAQIIPGRGGAPGGDGGPQAEQVSAGGFGGGAVQLASCNTLTIGADAVIDAGGGGGGGGNGSLQATIDPGGGAGGGSGGSILIEAPVITLAGGMFANGGAGGSGGAHGLNGTPGVDGMPGADGARSVTPAMGGGGVIVGTIITGAGGNGGALNTDPTGGVTPTATAVESSGGGGGAAGRIRVNVRSGTTATLTGAIISPLHSAGDMATD